MKSNVNALGRRIDLNLLVVFEAIYRSRNLTTAGRSLGLSQPAMSHALARLRAIYRDPLFVRLPRGLEPTPRADEVAPAVMEGLAIVRGGLERTTFDPPTSRRIFRIGMGDIGEVVLLPDLVRRVATAAPHVKLRTSEVAGTRLREALADGAIDVATGDYPASGGCREAALYEAEYACVVRDGHPVIRSRLTLAQFKAAEHILVKPEGAAHHGEVIERALSGRDVRARIAVQIAHFHGVAALVAATDYIATVPSRLARSLEQLAHVRVFKPPIALPTIKVSLYWHERFHRDPGNEWLRNAFFAAFKNAARSGG